MLRWVVLGAGLSWVVAAGQAHFAPSTERYVSWRQWPDGRQTTAREVFPKHTQDLMWHANDDGSTTYTIGRPPSFRIIPFPDGPVVHSPRGGAPQIATLNRTPRVKTEFLADVYGWPSPCAAVIYSRSIALFSAPSAANTPYKLELGVPLPGFRHSLLAYQIPRALPLLPWPGLLLNAPMYGLLLWTVWMLAIRVRAQWRFRHGRCPRCAYPLPRSQGQDRAGCSECGWRSPPLGLSRAQAECPEPVSPVD